MPLPSTNFQALFPLQELIVDKDSGEPLSAGIVTFYEDENRTVLKDVYQQVQLPDNTYAFVALNNPLTLSAVGTFQDNNGIDIIPFLYPYAGSPSDTVRGEIELYYITVYAAIPPVGTGTLQLTREAWPPNVSMGSSGSASFQETENELANPQFVEVSFSPTTAKVFTVSGSGTETVIAPDWSLITDGSGSVTVTWVAITDVDAPTNPPYALNINSSGITTLALRQRLNNSPRFMANGFISASLTVRNAGGITPIQLVMTYIPSTGTPVTLIDDLTTSDGNFSTLSNTAAINNSNTDSGAVGYVDISINIPVAANIEITSLQIVGVETLASAADYIQQTTARQIDHLFHYYKDSIIIQPKASILTGWNFALNPWQFLTTAATTIVASKYTADQTIVSVQNGSSLQSLAGTNTGYFGVQAVGAAAQGKFAIIQYIDTRTIAPYWGEIVSSLVKASISTTHSTALQFKMRLIYRANVPPAVDPISSWAATDPTFTAGWTAIAPPLDNVYTVDSATIESFPFNGFQLPSAAAGTKYLGIVLYTVNTMDSSGTPDVVYFDKVSLIPNEFALDSPPQTYDQVLSECQMYYEKSYAQNVLPGTVVAGGGLLAQQGTRVVAFNDVLATRPFGFSFKNICRTDNPTVTLYSPQVGTSASVFGFINVASTGGGDSADIAASNWTETQKSSTGVSYIPNNDSSFLTEAAGSNISTWIIYHYTKDGRLGLIA